MAILVLTPIFIYTTQATLFTKTTKFVVGWGVCFNRSMIDISIFLARFLGGFYLIFALLFVFARVLGRTIEMTDNKVFVIFTGYISLLMGLTIVALHGVWTPDWRGVITLLGWFTLVKGVLKIGFPDIIHKQAQRFKGQQTFEAIILGILGAWLLLQSVV